MAGSSRPAVLVKLVFPLSIGRWTGYDPLVSLEAFGLKNLRCLVDTGLVPIRPITLLVGRNSSGKSTFLRAFPLLRQSVETRRNTPILWYGDEHPVDFGSLRDASSAWLDEPSVTFMFGLRLPREAGITIGNPPVDIEMTIRDGEAPHVSEYGIRVEEHEVRWAFNSAGRATSLTVNGSPVAVRGPMSLGGKAHLLATLQPSPVSEVVYTVADETLFLSGAWYSGAADEELLPPLVDSLAPLHGQRMSVKGMSHIAADMLVGSTSNMLGYLRAQANERQYQRDVGALIALHDSGKPAPLVDAIVSAALARTSPLLLEAADRVLASLLSRTVYLAPLRVSAQRAYRITNYAVEEVDPDGKNLAMFLRSLSPEETESFAAFTRDALGFETRIQTTKIHAEILVRAGASKRFSNLVDVGFGYSEVLPLAAVLWNSCIRPVIGQREPSPLVTVEQPELHLHPAHQARLARMFVEAVTRSPGTRMVVETHSESLINGLGKLVYEGRIKADDVQIVLFDQDEETERTEVRLAGYRETGALRDWPYGFLSPVAERRSSSPARAAE